RPAALRARVEQRVVLGAVGRIGVGAVEAVLRRDPVLGVDLGGTAAVAVAELGADRRQVGEVVAAAQAPGVVVGVCAAVVVERELGGAVHVQRRAEAMGVAQRAEQAGGLQPRALLFHPPQFGGQRVGLTQAPFQRRLGLGQRVGRAL